MNLQLPDLLKLLPAAAAAATGWPGALIFLAVFALVCIRLADAGLGVYRTQADWLATRKRRPKRRRRRPRPQP